MRISSRGLNVEIPEHDARAAQIRRILLSGEAHPERRLWNACTDRHRQFLLVLANNGEMSQAELEAALHLDGIGLRGLTTGLAKIVRRLGIPPPTSSVGGRRSVRRFAMEPNYRQFVRALATKGKARQGGSGKAAGRKKQIKRQSRA
jgi:hypothetical protein